MLQIETLNQFRDRTQGFSRDSLPREGCFETRDSLTVKVGRSGEFLPFAGNTTVFLLEEEAKDRVEKIQDTLYESCGDMLADPLEKDSFHMTKEQAERQTQICRESVQRRQKFCTEYGSGRKNL